MPTATLVPDGQGTVGSNWGGSGGSPLYTFANIDEGNASPNDADYITCTADNSSIFYTLTGTGGDFVTATGVTIRFRALNASKATPRKFATCQIFASDETTALTDAMVCTGTTTSFTTLVGTPTIIGATSKTAWDGARIKITTNSGGTGTPFCSMIQVEVAYSDVSSGAAGRLVGRGIPGPILGRNLVG